MHRIKILINAICGELIKLYYKLGFGSIPYGLNQTEEREEKVTVSLTSYGRRVKSVVSYTIISLLRQTYKPDRIVLWLGEDHWNDENLPACLKRLKKYGLTVNYCRDVKSYKKLVPSLNTYSEDIIITFDDDVFYRNNLVELLVNAYKKDPSCIYSHVAENVIFSSKGKLLSYSDWSMCSIYQSGRLVFPLGYGGCLYKRSLLYKDICREDLFMKLAPKADDVWFYFMEFLQGTKCTALPYSGRILYAIDFFYQYTHKNANLMSTNRLEGQNDVQIRAIMEYYRLKDSDLRDSDSRH